MAKVKSKTHELNVPAKPQEKPTWLKFSDKDVEAIIVKLAKQGLTSEKIGLVLRDTYGIPKTRLYVKKIGKILKENNLYKDANLFNLEKKQQRITAHLKKNKKDEKSKRALSMTTADVFEHRKYEKRKHAEPN
jgi:small subunit ribosomal protein S15